MPTAEIVFPTTSSPGVRPRESGGRLINAFAEKAPRGAASQLIIRRTPGLVRRADQTASYTITRGFLDGSSLVFWILGDRAVKFDSAFAVTDLGALSGNQPITAAKNNAATPDYVVVTENGCFNLLTGSAPTSFADPDLPASPTSVCDFNGYFVWTYGNGKIYASDLNSVAVNALSFNTEQGLIARRGVRYAGRLYIFGDKWTAVYRDAGLSPFPFAREVTIPRGIVNSFAVAGWESGWANQLIWAGDDFIVYRLEGYTPVPISTDDVSRSIQSSVLGGTCSTIQAFVYMYERNAFWVLTCPGNWTWEYNLFTGEWNEKLSFNDDSWRGLSSIRAFSKWIVGSYDDGQLFEVSGSYFREGAAPLIWHVESGVLHAFPRGMHIPRTSFNITTGVGSTSVTDPRIEISWSLDGGYKWGEPVLRMLGGLGETESHPYILNAGISKGQGIRYRLRVSDDVHVGLTGGSVEVEQRGFSG